MNNLRFWDAVKHPPESALKAIGGGRMKGKTDISPLWRMQIMTETFGPVGVGWKYEVVKFWTEQGHEEIMAFAQVNMYYKDGDDWSEAIPGIGGSMLIEKERAGLHNSDEAFKMALTDALSVSMKALGVAADIYMGKTNGSKYTDQRQDSPKPEPYKKADVSTDPFTGIDMDYYMNHIMLTVEDKAYISSHNFTPEIKARLDKKIAGLEKGLKL